MAFNGRAGVALITGGGTGVGAAAAAMLAERGYHVVVNYSRSAAEAEATVAALKETGADALAIQGSVADDADCRRMVSEVVERWGRLDILINSAGTTQFTALANLQAQNSEDFHRVFDVNVVGTYQMVRAASEHLTRSNKGAVVNISSIAGPTGNGSSLAYIASKGALNSMTLALARLLAPKVRVNAVLPGMISSRWMKDGLGEEAFAGVARGFAEASALGDISSPEEIAAGAIFLACDATKMTGQLMTIDGGYTLGRAVKLSR